MDNISRATLLGSIALFLWALEPILVSEITGMPVFEAMSIILFASFIPNALRLTYKKKWHVVKGQPLYVWFVGVVCVCGNDLFYILGANRAPIAHVDLIDSMWPCLVVLFVGLLPKEQLKIRHIIGVFFGLIGILVLITDGHHGFSTISSEYTVGYFCAFIGAILWALYSAFSRYHKDVPSDMVGMYCVVGFIISVISHFMFEVTTIPSTSQVVVAVLTGLTGPGLAYMLWDYGVKHGNVRLLSSLTYFTRILGMVLIVVFGKQPLTQGLVVACSLASIGVFLVGSDSVDFKEIATNLKSRLTRKISLVSIEKDTLQHMGR